MSEIIELLDAAEREIEAMRALEARLAQVIDGLRDRVAEPLVDTIEPIREVA